MPGLFDQVKDSVLGIFGGTGVNPQASLRDAGAAAILSDTSDPLEAIASASMAGRQRQAVEQNKAQLQGLVQNAGMDLQSMQRVFLELLGQGDVNAARTVSEVLKTMTAGTAGSAGVNSQMVNTVASRQAGAPVHVLERFGEGAEIQVPRDPRTNQYDWDAAVPTRPTAGQDITRMDIFNMERTSRNDFRTDVMPQVAAYKQVQDALDLYEAELTSGDSTLAAANIQYLYAFIKAMDPETAVREGEIKLVGEATPLVDSIKTRIQEFSEGRSPVLSEETARQMTRSMKAMQKARGETIRSMYDAGAETARAFNLDESRVLGGVLPPGLFSTGTQQTGPDLDWAQVSSGYPGTP